MRQAWGQVQATDHHAVTGEIALEQARSGSVRVLIVDDDPYFRFALATILAADEKLEFVVSEAGDGDAALESIAAHEPDVVVLDLEMPRMDGLALARAIRQRWRDLRLVMMTAFDSPETRERAEQAGVDAFLGKSTLPDLRLSEFLSQR
jgi:DNA-binding NarL/FixJ family response regulator